MCSDRLDAAAAAVVDGGELSAAALVWAGVVVVAEAAALAVRLDAEVDVISGKPNSTVCVGTTARPWPIQML